MLGKVSAAIAVIAAGILMQAASAGAEDDPRPLSPAQVALFESDHLKAIEKPDRLEYRFTRATAAEGGGWVDQVELDVRPRGDGAKDVWVDFLTGEHHLPFPPVMGFRGNPVLMYFLDRDVGEMSRLTGGTTTYFRNRIRQAFVDKAEVKPVEVERDGRKESATLITLAPFQGEAHLAGSPGMQSKRYRFVLSDKVPGTIYEIGAEVPAEAGQAPLLAETMTFAAEHPCTTESGPCVPPKQP